MSDEREGSFANYQKHEASRRVRFYEDENAHYRPNEGYYEHELTRNNEHYADDEFINERVRHLDAETVTEAMNKGRDRVIEVSPRLDVQEVTSRLKESYENIDRGQDVLRKVFKELHQTKSQMHCTNYNPEARHDVDRLMHEVENLQKSLQVVGKRKKKYLEELSHLQSTLHNDRGEMENWVQQQNSPRQTLWSRLDESSKVTRQQSKLIQKLRSDNASLWKLLQEVQEHLRQENIHGSEATAHQLLYSKCEAPKKLPEIPKSSGSSESTVEDCRMSSNSSSYSQEYLSDRLRHLIEQSENVKRVVSEKQHQSKPWAVDKATRDCRIPSENENGVRSDMNDIISRCEDLERKVDECSTKDIRDRLMHQLHEIDKESSSASSTSLRENHWNNDEQANCTPLGDLPAAGSWNPEQHKRAREDLLKCLDKIVLLERNFNITQEEIRRLRSYIKETAEEKEFCEKTYKREAYELRKVVEAKTKKIESLKADLNDSLKYLKENEALYTKIEVLEEKLRAKDEKIQKYTSAENETRLLKVALEEKGQELQRLKHEMRLALDAMERLRLHGEYNEDSNITLKSEVKSLKHENGKLRASIEENIQDELSLLQAAISDAERRMTLMREENTRLREGSVKERSGSGVEIENLLLVSRLKEYEDQLEVYRAEKIDFDTKKNVNEALVNRLHEELQKVKVERDATEKDLKVLKGRVCDGKTDVMINQLVMENSKLTDENQKKERLIDEFKSVLTNVSKEWDKQVVNSEFEESLVGHFDKKYFVDDALHSIKESLRASHYELVEKVVALHQELKEMKGENYALRNNVKEISLQEKVEKLLAENESLRELASNSRVDETMNTENDDLRRLLDENNLLRMALNRDRKELVESNLRKRDRVNFLESEVEGLKKSADTSNLLANDNKRRKSRESSCNEKAVFAEMIQQNEIIRKLQEENERLRLNSSINKQDKMEIEELKSEREKWKQMANSNESFRGEIQMLKNTLRQVNNSEEIVRSRQRIADLEKELEAVGGNDGMTPNRSPDGKYKGSLESENTVLRRELDKALGDIEKLVQVIERRKTANEGTLKKKKSASCDDLNSLGRENKQLKKSCKDSKQSLDESLTEITYLRRELNSAEMCRQETDNEVKKLKAANQKLCKERNKDSALKGSMQSLKDELIDLRSELEKTEIEKSRQQAEFMQTKLMYEEKVNASLGEIRELREEKTTLEEEYTKLVEQYDSMRQNTNESSYTDWLQADMNRRFSLLSPDENRGGDRRNVRDHGRVIRKLQVENQTLRAKLLSLEDENVEATKIIADLERGHGHLTGTLRTHLVLQKTSTAKLLEGTIEQYASDFETFKRKFHALEAKYDKEKKYSNRRDHAWDLFTNASTTISNIHSILNEGFIKFEDDLEKDLDEEFLKKDYKSRLWILRRQLSDVENRHRELQLRSEELNLRLHAKTTEYEVTQEELEDTTRDLESRETSMQTLKRDTRKLSLENEKLNQLIKLLQANEEKTVKEILSENDALKGEICELSESHDSKMKDIHSNMMEMVDNLESKHKSLSEMKRMRDAAQKATGDSNRRVDYLERKLAELTEQRDKLKREAEGRVNYMAKANEDRGTIHLLRDDIKTLAKENSELKQELVVKQRQMYDMSKDLHSFRMQSEQMGKKGRRNTRKDEVGIKMVQEISELKAEKFMMETKLKHFEKSKGKVVSKDDEEKFLESAFKNQLMAKEAEIQTIKREMTYIKTSHSRSPSPSKEISYESQPYRLLEAANLKLKESLKEAEEQRESEAEILTKDINQKRYRIKELLQVIEELKRSKVVAREDDVERLVDVTEIEEQQSLMLELEMKDRDVQEWKKKAQEYESELRNAVRSEEDKFKKVYLNKMTPVSSSGDGCSERRTPAEESLKQDEDHSKKSMDGLPTYTIEEAKEMKPSKIPVLPKRRPPVPAAKDAKTRGKWGEEDASRKVNHLSTIQRLEDEIDVYRTALGTSKHDNLTVLRPDELSHVIQFNICRRYETNIERLQNDIHMLSEENDFLKKGLEVEEKENPEVLVLAERCSLMLDENKTIRELLETQTQNVKCQERVIKALKEDMEKCKGKYTEHCDRLSDDLKDKKRELRSVKKQMKGLKQSDRQSTEADDDTISKDLEKVIQLRNQNLWNKAEDESLYQLCKVKNRELESKLIETEEKYESVLKQAENALEDAKQKLTLQHQHNQELTKKVREISEDKVKQEKAFEDIKQEMADALTNKNTLLSKLQKDFHSQKIRKEEEYNSNKKQMRELEQQCRDYKMLLENSESTTSEFIVTKSELGHAKDELRGTKSRLEELRQKNQELVEKNESLANTLDLISDDRSMKTDVDEKEAIDFEIEYEILKGCNEELEEQVQVLEARLRESEVFIQHAENQINDAQREAETSLVSLRELGTRNEELEELAKNLEAELRGQGASVEHCLKDKRVIKELEAIIDELQDEVRRRGDLLEGEKVSRKISSAELQDVVNELEKEIQNKDKQIAEFAKQKEDELTSEELLREMTATKWTLNEQQKEICRKSEEIECLQKSLEEWIRKSVREHADCMQGGSLLEQSKQLLDTSAEIEQLSSKHSSESLDSSKGLLDEMRKQNGIMVRDLQEKCKHNEKLTSNISRLREEMKEVIRTQERLQHENMRKENVIRKLKMKLKANQLSDSLELAHDDENTWLSKQEDVKALPTTDTQVSILRARNKALLREMHENDQNALSLKTQHVHYEDQISELKSELFLTKEKVNELRVLVHDKCDDHSLNSNDHSLKSKVIAAYDELREKTVQIASLNLKLDMKNREVESLRNDGSVVIGSTVERVECHEQELLEQNAQLRHQLISKSRHCDFLQSELFKLVGKMKLIERKLRAEDQELRDRYISCETSEATEVTPLTANTLRRARELSEANETFLLDGFDESRSEARDYKRAVQTDEFLYYKEQIAELRGETKDLQVQKKALMKEMEAWRSQFYVAERKLLAKDEEIKTLETQLCEAKMKVTSNENEIRKQRQEQTVLIEQLETQRRCYDNDIENTKSTYLQVKEEHIRSLQEELRLATEEKLKLQVQVKECEQAVLKREVRFNELCSEKQQLEESIEVKESETDELVNALSLLEAENIRLVDCLNKTTT